MNHKSLLQGFALISTLLFSAYSYGRVDAASVLRSLSGLGSSPGMTSPSSGGNSGAVGCGDKVTINCDTHEIDDGNHKSKVNCGKDTPKNYHGKVGQNRKGAGTAWPSMKNADVVDPEPGLCGSGGCVFHTIPPSHENQGGEEPAGFNTTADHTGCVNPSPEILKDLESPSCKGKAIDLTFNTKSAGGDGGGSGKSNGTSVTELDITAPEYIDVASDSIGDAVSNPAKAALKFIEQSLMYVLSAPVWAAPAPSSEVWQIPLQLIGAHDMIAIDSYDPSSDTFTVKMVYDLHPNPLPVSPSALAKAIPNLKTPIAEGRFNQIINAQFSTDEDLRVLFKFEMLNRRLAMQKQHGSSRSPASIDP